MLLLKLKPTLVLFFTIRSYICIQFFVMKFVIIPILIAIANMAYAQTETDGIMMRKKLFCAGIVYSQSTWINYWEGTLKRENLNIGTVHNNSVNIMGNYGLTNKINIIFNIPYIKTKASAGQLAGQQGLQDGSLFLKYNAFENKIKNGFLNTIIIAGATAPLSNYTPDLLPLSIGLKSNTASIRLMLDYQLSDWFATASDAYIFRSNVRLDRNSYYTTQMHYSNMVQMSDAHNFNFQLGYRSKNLIVAAIISQWNTLQGFDISRNNMPFVSNKMDATMLGLHCKYDTKFLDGFSIIADGNMCLAGRNVGQTKVFGLGAFYVMNFKNKKITN
jgi:hypothetical protein